MSSYEIGKEGEQIVINHLRSYFGAKVMDVSTEAHKGDVHVDNVLIEVKNYGSTVDVAEFDKFVSDTDKNENISVGIMLSLKSPIQYRSGNEVLTTLGFEGISSDSKKPILLIGADEKLSEEIIVAAVVHMWHKANSSDKFWRTIGAITVLCGFPWLGAGLAVAPSANAYFKYHEYDNIVEEYLKRANSS